MIEFSRCIGTYSSAKFELIIFNLRITLMKSIKPIRMHL